MLYNLLAPMAHDFHFANLMTYITFRSVLAVILSFFLSIAFGPRLISYFRTIQKQGQPIRDDGPATHFQKAGTPTMGGVLIVGSSVFATLLLADLTNPYIWISLFVFIMFAFLGFLDDYTKVSRNNYRGISGKMKLIIQFLVSIVAFAGVMYFAEHEYSTTLTFPFFKNFTLELGYIYFPFAMCVIIGASNAVNLTDGLDGLAIGTSAVAVASFALIAYLVGNSIYAHYLQVVYVLHASELTVLCASVVGSSIGFLWFNAKPAEIFMGDTGSLALGGLLGIVSVIVKHEIVLSIIGGVFVLETLSVIIQVYYFKFTGGKRFFLMAPIHHHFEKKGLEENKVVIRFWCMALVFALIGLSSLKLR